MRSIIYYALFLTVFKPKIHRQTNFKFDNLGCGTVDARATLIVIPNALLYGPIRIRIRTRTMMLHTRILYLMTAMNATEHMMIFFY